VRPGLFLSIGITGFATKEPVCQCNAVGECKFIFPDLSNFKSLPVPVEQRRSSLSKWMRATASPPILFSKHEHCISVLRGVNDVVSCLLVKFGSHNIGAVSMWGDETATSSKDGARGGSKN
jgi:hypothetical protein